jgi:hypothetical protein
MIVDSESARKAERRLTRGKAGMPIHLALGVLVSRQRHPACSRIGRGSPRLAVTKVTRAV